mmetsp:Transcript_3959/g.8160  ORF Transcript_3959/g.8160 Transcript_3959/m.8160 type:complete len:257 (-) Transcript_3959:758-1528(-)
MVPYSSGHKDVFVVHPAALMQVVIRGLEHLLHLNLAPWRFHIAEGVVLLPFLALLQPLVPEVIWRCLDKALHGLQGMLGVCPDGDGGRHHLAKATFVDVDVDDAASALSLRRSGLWSVLVHDTCGAIVEAAAYGDDAIRILNREVGICRPVHPQHVQRQRVPLVEDAHAMNGGRHRYTSLPRNRSQNFGAMTGALPDVEDGPPGLVDELDRLLDGGHIHHGRRVSASSPLEDRLWHLRSHGDDVLRQVYVHRPWTA